MTFNSQITSSQISIPGFSAEQVAPLAKLMKDMIDSALDKRFGPLPPPQPNQAVTMPKSAQPSKQKQEQQAIGEDNAESTAESISCLASSRSDNMSLLSTISHSNAKQICRESAFCVSNASFLVSFSDLFSAFVSLLKYIRHAEGMETTGQG